MGERKERRLQKRLQQKRKKMNLFRSWISICSDQGTHYEIL